MSLNLLEHIARSERAFLATILATQGHTYKKAGAKALFEAGKPTPVYGNLGSQCVDQRLIELGTQALETGCPVQFHVDLADENDVVFGYGAYCGGQLDILLEPLGEPERLAYREVGIQLESGSPCVLTHDRVHGGLQVQSVHPRLAEAHLSRATVTIEDANERRFTEIWPDPMRVVLFGSTPLSRELALRLRELDFRPTVVDWRESHLKVQQNSLETELIEPGDLGNVVTPDTCVLVVSHVFERDRQAIESALTAKSGFVGLLSSSVRREKMFAELQGQGIDAETIERIHSPLGIDIQGQTDQEIAVSVVAQLIRFRNG